VPLLPLAQTTDGFDALTPRSEAVVPLDCGVHDCAALNAAKKRPSDGRTVFSKVTRNARVAPYDLQTDARENSPEDNLSGKNRQLEAAFPSCSRKSASSEVISYQCKVL
jgi:hypothetical protein